MLFGWGDEFTVSNGVDAPLPTASADSDANWTLIPVDTGHQFRTKGDSDCGGRPTTVVMFTGTVWGV